MSYPDPASGGRPPGITVARPSLVLFWLRTDMVLAGRLVTVREPVTIMGLVPLKSIDVRYPLDDVATAGAITTTSVSCAVAGVLSLLPGLLLVGDNALLGTLLIVLGVLMLVNAPCAVFFLIHNSGGVILCTCQAPMPALHRTRLLVPANNE